MDINSTPIMITRILIYSFLHALSILLIMFLFENMPINRDGQYWALTFVILTIKAAGWAGEILIDEINQINHDRS